VRANQIYYIHPDHLGRPEKVTNSGKAIVWKANNYGFNRGVALDSIGGLNLGFPGQYWDAESGLFENGNEQGRYAYAFLLNLRGEPRDLERAKYHLRIAMKHGQPLAQSLLREIEAKQKRNP
jgi:hypothetical protein